LKSGFIVTANIPYYITSLVIRRLLESEMQPSRIVLTVQREVAERICALPGEMNLLALAVQVYSQPRIAMNIPASAFYPIPEVDSAVIRADVYEQPGIPRDRLTGFFRLAQAGFSQKRKMLRNTLASGLHISTDQSVTVLRNACIDPQRRAQTLSIGEWKRITECAYEMGIIF
jgi:16S rRNA (adenine1518-N6/adenine1519-N6)-dimethyltransferase